MCSETIGARPRVNGRIVAAVALAAASFAVAASAFGDPIVDFFTADPAPERVVRDFASLGVGAPEGMDPGVIPGETRKAATVRLNDALHTLSVAPTRQGGFCTLWTRAGGGCDRAGAVPLSVSYSARRRGLVQRDAPERFVFDLVGGHALAKYVDEVQIRFANGDVARLAVTWVAAPIGAGFFLYDVPQEHQREGAIEAVVGLRDGDVVVWHESPRLAGDVRVPAPDAVLAKRKAVARIETRSGPAILWTAPTRYDGHCAWLEYAGRNHLVVRCIPDVYAGEGTSFRFIPTRRDVLMVGTVGRRPPSWSSSSRTAVASASARTEAGFLLYRIPPDNQHAGAELIAVTPRDATGGALFRAPVRSDAAILCYRPLPLPDGAPDCP